MSRYNTGIGDNVPSVLDFISAASGFVADLAQLLLGRTQTSFEPAAMEDTNRGTYDPKTYSWEGTGGLRYRVPLFPIPSERHTRDKVRNVNILMDNCRRLCVQDELPSTPEEKRFWYAYRFIKYELFIAPAVIVTPPLYFFSKIAHDRLPQYLRGRALPLFGGLALAELWANATYPSYQLLSTALRAKTPMGDAARAEWSRLQPISIPYHIYLAYQLQHFLDSVPVEYQFGGDLPSLCN